LQVQQKPFDSLRAIGDSLRKSVRAERVPRDSVIEARGTGRINTKVQRTRTLNLIEKLGEPEPVEPAIAPEGAMRIPRMFES
jgi:hypothetical protein